MSSFFMVKLDLTLSQAYCTVAIDSLRRLQYRTLDSNTLISKKEREYTQFRSTLVEMIWRKETRKQGIILREVSCILKIMYLYVNNV